MNIFKSFKFKIFFPVVAAIVIILIGAGISFAWGLGPASKTVFYSKEIKVLAGMGVSEIESELYSKNIIRSKFAFGVYSFFAGYYFKFKPGVYELNSAQSVPEIIKSLVSGPAVVTATIPPGMSLNEVDDYLSGLKIINTGDLANFPINDLKNDYAFLAKVNLLEGFIFPDTYQFFAGSRPKDVIKKILDNFSAKALPLFGGAQNFWQDAVYNKLILASILEKEIPDQKERRIAAGIFEKRIKNKMPLQVDATVIYQKCGGRYAGCEVSSADFKVNSLYNTYKNLGYPPTPISNPGLESISAAFNPIASDYWYYLSDLKTKKTIFSKTFQEHLKNQVIHL